MAKEILHNYGEASLRSSCKFDKDQLQIRATKQGKDIEKLKKHLGKVQDRLERLEDALETKVETEELQYMRDLVLRLPDVAEVDKLRSFVSTNIESFRVDNFNFNKDF